MSNQELIEALRQSNDALVELMACSAELLNSQVGRKLYGQCHSAVLNSGRVLDGAKAVQ